MGDPPILVERALPGLHDAVFEVLRDVVPHGSRIVELGAGSGAMTRRLAALGHSVLAVDIDDSRFGAGSEFMSADLNEEFAGVLGRSAFDAIVAVELIEHLENPIGFLRKCRDLLKPGGVMIVTTPNVDSLLARVKFLTRGQLHLMEPIGDDTHITPIFRDLFTRQYLPRSGFRLVRDDVFPRKGYAAGAGKKRKVISLIASRMRSRQLNGDINIFVLAEV